MLTAEKIIEILKLTPLQNEGGFYRETWRSQDTIPESALPDRYLKSKSFGTAIYYLLTTDTKSKIHRLPTDEIFHFYLGDPVEMLILYPDGNSEIIMLGQKIDEGESVQVVIPKGTWFGARLKKMSGRTYGFALMGTTVAPGFDFSDFEIGKRKVLAKLFPDKIDLIKILT
jgi:uncharacterized protein